MFESQDDARKGQEPLVESTSPPLVGAEEALTRPEFFLALSHPRWTYVLMGAILIVFVGMIVYGQMVFDTWNGSETIEVLINLGAKVNVLILQGQTWRLFTAMFLHIGVLHLLFNTYALYALGPMVEGYFGHWRFLAIYLLGGLWGSLASYAFSPAISAGASGAIFALAGAITVYFLRYHENFGRRGRAILQNMAVIIGINLLFGFAGRGIDNWGHIGGLVGGAVIAWGLLPRYSIPEVVQMGRQPVEKESRGVMEGLWVCLILVLYYVGLQFANQITPTQF